MSPLPHASLLAAELLKVRKRWLPYIVLLPVVFALAFQTFVAYFAGWRDEGDIEALRVAALPWSLASLLDLSQFLGALLLGILAASMAGTEYGWGTVRQALVRGQPRSQYLTIKLLAIVILGIGGFLLMFGAGVLFSIIVTRIEGLPITIGEDRDAGDVTLMVVRTAYSMLPYVLLAFTLAVIGRSTTLGVVGVVLFMFLEAIVHAILTGIGGTAADARAFFIAHNVMALLAFNRLGPFEYFSLAPRGSPFAFELPDAGVAALVLAIYCGIFLAVTYWVFLRRDLAA